MHGILAITALHLRRLRPSSACRYNYLAIHHYTSGVSLFRLALDRVTKENALPVFIFSSLIVCISFALPQPPLQELDRSPASTGPLQSILDVFSLERGIDSVVRTTWHWLMESPLASQLHLDLQNPDFPIKFDDDIALSCLEARIHAEVEHDPMEAEYLDAMRCLREVYTRGSTAVEHKSAILAWPVMVSPGFYGAISERAPPAIVILSFYGALLHELRDIWWLGSAGVRIVGACSDLLDSDWDKVICLAKQRVGLK